MKELKYFYLTANGSTVADYVPRKDKELIPITKEEWEQMVASHQKKEPSVEEQIKKQTIWEINYEKKLLASTDWIVIKIAEETDPEEQAALREKYTKVIADRKTARAHINQLEQSLKGE